MRYLAIPLILSLIIFAGAPASAAAKADSPSAQFVQKLGDKALTSLTAKGLPQSERSKRVRSLLRENFDIKTIGQFVLGTHWKEATPTQQQEYLKLFEDMIVQTYTGRFAEYSGQSFKVTGSGDAGNDELIKSQILQKDGPPIDVDWRVRDKGGSLKIVDVYVDSVSMGITQRADFDGVIQAGGGKFEALLESLRKHQMSAK